MPTSTIAPYRPRKFGPVLVCCMIGTAVLGASAPLSAQVSTWQDCDPERCEIVLTRIATLSDREDPGMFVTGSPPLVARDSAGRLFQAARHGVVVFDQDGGVVRRIGGPGQGPGEFQFTYYPLIGPGDSLHVFDVRLQRLTVLGPELTVERTNPGVRHPASLIRADGSYIVAGQIQTPDHIGFPVHLMSPEGTVLTSFGTDTPQHRPDLPLATTRVAGLSGDGTVWTAPPGEYRLERWDPRRGVRLDSVEVESPWFRQSVRLPRDESMERPVSLIQGIWEDEDGLVWVLARDAAEDWQPAETSLLHQTLEPEARNRIHDAVLEVIDPATGAVLVSRRFDERLWVHPGSGLLTSHETSDPFVEAFDVWIAHLHVEEEPR